MFRAAKWTAWKRRWVAFRDGLVQLRKSQQFSRLFLEPLEDRTLMTAWTALGPAPLASLQGIHTPAVSGRITGIAADPSNANILYVAAAGGGLWKTTNADSTTPAWTPLTDHIPGTTDSMGSVAVAPSNSSVIYAGTGEANNSQDSNDGEGILVSTNGGSSWKLEDPGGVFTRLSVGKIVIDPTNADVAYAAVGTDGVNGNFAGTLGIYKTSDGGATWTNTTASITTSNSYSDVVLNPNNPNILYAAVGNTFGSSANGIYESTNGGTSWSLLSGFPNGSSVGRIALALAPSNPSVIYAVAATPSGALDALEVSTDGGADWTDRTSLAPNFLGSQGWYDIAVAVDPTNANHVYVGGQATGLLESLNGGLLWTNVGTVTSGVSPFGDHHALTFDANGKLLDGNDGGIFRLDTDILSPLNIAWTDLNGNLNTLQFYGISLNSSNGNILGGSQDHGSELYTSATGSWTQVNPIAGDGGMTYLNGTVAYGLSPVEDAGPANFFAVSTDGGSTWKGAATGLNSNDTMNFYPTFAVDPSNADRVLFGSNQLYQTTNEAGSWTKLTTTGTSGWDPKGNAVDAIGLAGSDAKTIYAATGGWYAGSSQVFVSSDGGSTWTERDLPSGSGRVDQILVDPNSAQTAYVVVSSYVSAPGHVFKTTNGGQTWTNISGNLPNLPTWSIQLDSANNILYVGNDEGVFSSANGGTTWSAFGTGLANAQVFSLSYSPTLHILAAGTHGRGVWAISTAAPQVTLEPRNQTVTVDQTATFTAAASGFPAPTVQWQVSTDGGKTFSNITNATSSTLTLPNVQMSQNGDTYRAIFTNSAGSSPTTAATLTVQTPTPANTDKIGVFSNGSWYLDTNGNGSWDASDDTFLSSFGFAGALPIVGNWGPNGAADIGIYYNGSWYLNTDGSGVWKGNGNGGVEYSFGFAGATPVVGNWGPNGSTDIGIYYGGVWYLNTDGTGIWKGNGNGGVQYNFGFAGATPVVGNWGPNGAADIGIYSNGTWYVNTDGSGIWKGNGNGGVQYNFGFGGAIPVVGNWGPNGAADIGIYCNGTWYLNTDGTGVWNGNGNGGVQYTFGFTGATPVVGAWQSPPLPPPVSPALQEAANVSTPASNFRLMPSDSISASIAAPNRGVSYPMNVESPSPFSLARTPSWNMPPLMSFFAALLRGSETVNANGTETITDSLFGVPLLVGNLHSSGKLVSVTWFGINVTFLFG